MSRIDITLKEREQLYRLVISQLFYDGHQNLAVGLANQVKTHAGCPPSDRLAKIVALGLKAEAEQQQDPKEGPAAVVTSGIDLEYETDVSVNSPETALYETSYVTVHKAPCRVAVFHKNGQLIATGSEDTSIKIIDVDRILARSAFQADDPSQVENHPVIRTLYDHTSEVTALEFHPYIQMLISGGRDCTLKFFEFSKSSVKKAYRSITEATEIRCLSIHPSGDFLLVGTQHPTLRLYDINTGQCFVSNNPVDQHKGPITAVKYSTNANMYVTSSKDGDIKIWDGVSNKCVNTFSQAHDGSEVCSVAFTKNSKYILSSGKDSLVKLWELSTARCLIAYTGAGTTGKQQHRTQAIFNHTEDYVLFPDEKTASLCCWDSRNADRQRLLGLGHNNYVKCIVHSPIIPAFMSCSDDFRARFWCCKKSVE